MSTKPFILVSNDDGVHAPGIQKLISIVKELGDVFVMAPDKPQSAMGHAITINSTLRVSHIKKEENVDVYACSGTPVDCIKMAVNHFLTKKPDLVVSGINHGSNSSINVIYSGTMSAAMEGCIEGIPSIGFSLCDYSYEANFDAAESYIRKIIIHVLENGLDEGVCLNVNIPKLPEEEIKGIKVCRQAKAVWQEEFDERKDPYGRDYYWLTGKFINLDQGDDTDEEALKGNYISIVPIHCDFTAYNSIGKLKNIDWNK